MSINSHRDLRVYQNARDAAAFIFKLSLRFPAHERYDATRQVRAASRSVCANIGEAWRKRRYAAAFRSKLNDSEGEAAETQIWLDLVFDCGYITKEEYDEGISRYESIIAQLVATIAQAKTFASITPKAPSA